jgi:hypothetical protein
MRDVQLFGEAPMLAIPCACLLAGLQGAGSSRAMLVHPTRQTPSNDRIAAVLIVDRTWSIAYLVSVAICLSSFLSYGTNVFTKEATKTPYLLHSVLRGIQEWIVVTWPI